jgi:hypothetical protein
MKWEDLHYINQSLRLFCLLSIIIEDMSFFLIHPFIASWSAIFNFPRFYQVGHETAIKGYITTSIVFLEDHKESYSFPYPLISIILEINDF